MGPIKKPTDPLVPHRAGLGEVPAPTVGRPRRADPTAPIETASALPWTTLSVTRPDYAMYESKALGITDKQRTSVENGDVASFWASRLGEDPVARIGLAIWGSRTDLAKAIGQTGVEHWTPDMNLLSGIGLALQGYPPKLNMPPQTKTDHVQYWTWLGKNARKRVITKALDRGVLQGPGALRPAPGEPRTKAAAKKRLLKAAGLGLAKAHIKAVDEDMQNRQGLVPGLLSLANIADYHHEVFRSLGLPASTYGGTPVSVGPMSLQLSLGGGLYGRGADPRG